jgi:hypothetical protein
VAKPLSACIDEKISKNISPKLKLEVWKIKV